MKYSDKHRRTFLRNIVSITVVFIFGCLSLYKYNPPGSEIRRLYVEANPDLSSEVREAILEAYTAVGMSRLDLMVSLGMPLSISEEISDSMITHIYVYELIPNRDRIMFTFYNDSLVFWEPVPGPLPSLLKP